MSIYINKNLCLQCLFECAIITHDPLTDLLQILIDELGRTTGMFLA